MPEVSQKYLDENIGDDVIAVSIVFAILVTVCYILRLIAIRISKSPWGIDDWLMIPGMMLFYAFIGCNLADVLLGGAGSHVEKFASQPEVIATWAKYSIIIPVLIVMCNPFPKLAILFLYLRIFREKYSRYATWATIFIVAANGIGTTIPGFVMCIPLHKVWEPRTAGHCIDINAWYRWSTLANVVTDVIMLILPLPTIKRLQTSKKVKTGLIITFLVGGSGLITSVIRYAGFFKHNAKADPTWVAAELIILSVLETGFYFLAACLIRCKPLLQHARGLAHLKKSVSGSSEPLKHSNRTRSQDLPLTAPSKHSFTELDEECA